MPLKVFLDGLIQREDFEAGTEKTLAQVRKNTVSVSDLGLDDFFASALRKPDFQRETSEWDVKKVASLVENFVNGDLIPAVILWANQGNIFIIDGAHRLSALVAWVNDDYGDGRLTGSFFDGAIPQEFLDTASKARDEVDKRVGSYSSLKRALNSQSTANPDVVKRAKNLGSLAIQLQWVEGDPSKAESSFLTINQQGSQISDTEIKLLKSRTMPISIATRAIMRRGKGHKYWRNFDDEAQGKIGQISEVIYDYLFTPSLAYPIKTLDLPLAGKAAGAQTLPLIAQMLETINDIPKPRPDSDGSETLSILKTSKRYIERISSNAPSSLGLHPAIYIYSRRGAFRVASFHALILFMKNMDSKNSYSKFTDVRSQFEDFILEHEYIIDQIVRRYRGAIAAFPAITSFYEYLIDEMSANNTNDQIVAKLKVEQKYKYIKFDQSEINLPDSTGNIFDRGTKNEIYIDKAIQLVPRCAICGAMLHRNAISIDHIQQRRNGGSAEASNGQLAHPYCNTTYKN